MTKAYKNAFNCKKCPASNDKNGCPAWTELSFQEMSTGQIKPIHDCVFQLMPIMFIEMIKASNRPAAAIEATKNEIAAQFNQLAQIIPGVTQHFMHLIEHEEKGHGNS